MVFSRRRSDCVLRESHLVIVASGSFVRGSERPSLWTVSDKRIVDQLTIILTASFLFVARQIMQGKPHTTILWLTLTVAPLVCPFDLRPDFFGRFYPGCVILLVLARTIFNYFE